MAWREYVDPTTNEWWSTDDAGNFLPGRLSDNGVAPASPSIVPSGGNLDQMRNELRAAGYPGPWDDASVQAAYARTVNGGNAQTSSNNFSSLWQALTGSNQQKFDWDKDVFNRDLSERQRQFDQNLALQKNAQYSNLAQSMLGNSVSLRGPESWLDYAKYTTGGKDIFSRLYGSEPAPAFGAPTGSSRAMTIADILRDLGIVSGGMPGATPGPGQPSTPGAPAYDLNSINSSLQGLNADFWSASAPRVSPVIQQWIQTNFPNLSPDDQGKLGNSIWSQLWQWQTDSNKNDPTRFGSNTTAPTALPDYDYIAKAWQNSGLTAPAPDVTTQGIRESNPVPDAFTQATAPVSNPLSNAPGQYGNPHDDWGRQGTLPGGEQQGAVPGGTYYGSQPANNYQTPLPHQINPMVWDSMSDTAKKMILSSAEAGNTPSGVIMPDDFLRLLNASRPQGTAPRRVSTAFAGPTSYF